MIARMAGVDWVDEVRERVVPVAAGGHAAGSDGVALDGVALAVVVTVAAALVFVPGLWRLARVAVTLVHELGHAMVGLAVGRRFTELLSRRVTLRLGQGVTGLEPVLAGGVEVNTADRDEIEYSFIGDPVLFAVGRSPNSDTLAVAATGVAVVHTCRSDVELEFQGRAGIRLKLHERVDVGLEDGVVQRDAPWRRASGTRPLIAPNLSLIHI